MSDKFMKKSDDPVLLPRTKSFALRVICLMESLGEDQVARVFGHQLLCSGASVGTDYRSAARARSRADFVNRLKIAEEECDASLYWMELLVEAQVARVSGRARGFHRYNPARRSCYVTRHSTLMARCWNES